MTRSEAVAAGIARVRENGKEWGVAGKVLALRNKNLAFSFAQSMAEELRDVMVYGPVRLTDIAKELNRRQIPTSNGKTWRPSTVHRLLHRLGPAFLTEVMQARKERIQPQLAASPATL